jgi:hypothetical protein
LSFISKNPCITAALGELEKVGIRDVQIVSGSKHPQLRFHINGGPAHVFSVPGTPSDHRSPENTRRDLRRILRAAGVLATPDPRPAQPPRQPDRISLLEARVAKLEIV